MARILFITTKQPSTNPRMRKSADALAGFGHTVHVLYAYNTPWADEADKEILNQVSWSFERIGGHPKESRLLYHTTRVTRKIYQTFQVVQRGFCRGYNGYIRQGSQWMPDLVIGHNPGALGPLIELGSRLEIPILFDAEDYHRGETSPESIASNRIAKLEDKTLPHLKKVTAASPLITQSYATLYPHLDIHTVNNAFPSKYLQTEPIRNENTLSIAWFSQVVGLDRGLREFLDSLKFLQDVRLSVQIIGLSTREVQQQLRTQVTHCDHKIHFSPPIPEKCLFTFLSGFDIGLAIEPGFSANNKLARSNKLYSYALAGCYMLVSNTKAQREFLEEHPNAGELIDLSSPESVADVIRTLDANREDLLEKRKKAWLLAKGHLNWETESKQLIDVVNSMLNQ